MNHLTEFIKNNQSQTQKINLFQIEGPDDVEIATFILKYEFEPLVNFVERFAFDSDRKQVQKILIGLYLSQVPLYEIFDEVLTPVLHRIGEKWQNGEIQVLDEHLATDTLRDSLSRLQGVVRVPLPTRGKALCLMLPNEMHDIALKMTDYILEERGFEVYFGGAIPIPNFRLETIFSRIQPDRVYFSSTFVTNVSEGQGYLDEALQLCRELRAAAFVGGQGFSRLDFKHPSVVRRLQTFRELLLD